MGSNPAIVFFLTNLACAALGLGASTTFLKQLHVRWRSFLKFINALVLSMMRRCFPQLAMRQSGSKYVVMKADQERRAAIIRAEGESEAAKLVSEATAATGMGLIELRRIEASREITATLARSPSGMPLLTHAMFCSYLVDMYIHQFDANYVLQVIAGKGHET